MRASTKRILSILLSGVFLIGLIAVSTSLIRPEFSNVAEKRSLLFSKENLFDNQSRAVNQVRSLISEFQGFARAEETVSLAMPQRENTTQILNQLDAIARTSGVLITSLNISPKAFESARRPLVRRLGTIEITMTVEGSYDSVKNFMNFIETNVRVFNVNKMIVSSVQREGLGLINRLNLTVETYFQE